MTALEMATQYALQGQQAMQAGMFEQAAAAYYQAIQHAPQVDGLCYQYAVACLWRGLPMEALGALDRCMILRGPWYNHAQQLSSQVRSQLGMPGMGGGGMPGMGGGGMPGMGGGGMPGMGGGGMPGMGGGGMPGMGGGMPGMGGGMPGMGGGMPGMGGMAGHQRAPQEE